MKNLTLLLIISIFVISCQDELPVHIINPSENLITDNVDSTLILNLVNDIRTIGYHLDNETDTGIWIDTCNENIGKLVWNDNLYKAAQLQSIHMAKTGEFAHVWSDGTTPNDRARMFNIKISVGENIAWGYFDAEKVINGRNDGKGWINSETHRNNMLNKEFNIIGVAAKDGFWTMVLGYDPKL